MPKNNSSNKDPNKILKVLDTSVKLLEAYDKDVTELRPYKHKFEVLKQKGGDHMNVMNNRIKELQLENETLQSKMTT